MILENKEVLTLNEVSQFTGLSKSHIYKLVIIMTYPFLNHLEK